MDILKVILLAVEQGITELLPISSSAHLILSSQILNIKMDTYLLSVLHLGTTMALLIYFAPIFKKSSINFYLKILISTLPAALIGFFFESTIENSLRGNEVIAISLVFWGIIMILVERNKKVDEQDLREVTWKQSLLMGIGQTIALIPGSSRSGTSAIIGVLAGLNKYTAIQYSFLLGLPLLVAAPIYTIIKDAPERTLNISDLIGIVVAFIFTFLSLALLKRFSKDRWLTFFGIYRIILGIVVLLTILF